MKYLVCFDGSAGAKRALEYVEKHACADKDHVVLFGARDKVHSFVMIGIDTQGIAKPLKSRIY
jgi:hypothetical protein